MKKVFIDANIFFAASYSKNGGSALILELAKKKKIKIITVSYALAEAEKNIELKLGQKYLSIHHQNILDINPEIQSLDNLNLETIHMLENFLVLKDIPILAGALFSKAEFLITLDKRDFLDNKKLTNLNLPFKILNPENFIKNYF